MTKILTTKSDLAQAAAALKNGAVIVIPTETVYGLACAADNPAAIQKICAIKNRAESAPMQILLPDVAAALKMAALDARELAVANAFWPGPLTLVCKARAGGPALGLRVPAHPFTSRLLRAYGAPLAATSANKHGEPPLQKEAQVIAAFSGVVDYIFTAGDITGQASTVAQVTPLKMFREGPITKEQILKIIKN